MYEVDDAGLDKRFLRERKREKRREGGRAGESSVVNAGSEGSVAKVVMKGGEGGCE